jgi:hypothetical protein
MGLMLEQSTRQRSRMDWFLTLRKRLLQPFHQILIFIVTEALLQQHT